MYSSLRRTALHYPCSSISEKASSLSTALKQRMVLVALVHPGLDCQFLMFHTALPIVTGYVGIQTEEGPNSFHSLCVATLLHLRAYNYRFKDLLLPLSPLVAAVAAAPPPHLLLFSRRRFSVGSIFRHANLFLGPSQSLSAAL